MKQKLGILFIVLMIFMLGACTSTDDTSTQPKTDDTQSNTQNDTQNDAPSKIVFKDITGTEITLDTPAKRIVGTHNPSLNTAVVLGGGGKYLAGFGNKEMASGLYKLVIDDFEGLPFVGKGKNVNYETVASVNADIAILPERFKDDAAEYKNVGVQPIIALPNTESFDTIKQSLEIVGKALGEDARAKEINTFIDNQIQKSTQITANRTDKASVLFLGTSSPLSVAPDAMIQSQIIATAGGVNAVKDVDVLGSYADVNIEQIIKWNPEVIWIPSYATYTAEDLLADKEWANISAIKNKKVFYFPSKLEPWDYPTASAVLGVCWATYNLNPEIYSLTDLMADIDAFYTLVYGKTFTQEQLGIE